MKKLLIIAQQWPEPATNAAGIRMMQLIAFFKSWDYEIHLACAIPRTIYSLDIPEVITQEIVLNDPSFDHYVATMNPHIVIYDRFNIEEQYGWRLRENCPETIQILDTEDLHFLRKAREKALKQQAEAEDFYQDDIALRELASIYRCDLSLIISEYEMELLQEHFNIPESLLCYIPFMVDYKESEIKSYKNRRDYIMVGNLKHSPNKDAVLYLKNEIWPLIRKRLPQATVHVYGAYADQQISQLHCEKTGFLIKGYVEDLETIVSDARVVLAPLRYGAGLKGKLITAMECGTPAVMTNITAQGMYGNLDIPGLIADDPEEFAQQAVAIYTDPDLWKRKIEAGRDVMLQRFSRSIFENLLKLRFKDLAAYIDDHRKENFIGMLLQHHSMKSTKYLSKWIEEKNK